MIEEKRKELITELGELTYERGKLMKLLSGERARITKLLNENVKRINEIGDELEKLDGK